MHRQVWNCREPLNLRRMRIFTHTAAQPAIERVGDPTCCAVAEIGWRLAEGVATSEELASCMDVMRPIWYEVNSEEVCTVNTLTLAYLLCSVLGGVLGDDPAVAAYHLIVPSSAFRARVPIQLLTPDETAACCWLLRDIFGDRGNLPAPTGCPWWNPEWRTSTVVTLAERIYSDQCFDRLPILADAFEEAGCDNPDLLKHCRGQGRHVRGCWVVDLALGKGNARDSVSPG
jgi:hypothetical protein